MRRVLAFLFVLFMVPVGQAQFYDPIPYEDSSPFAAGFQGFPALVSAQTSYNATNAENATVFFGTNGATVSGMNAVYWRDGDGDFHQRTGDNLTVEVSDNGSFAFRTPGSYDTRLDAPYALSFFMDASALFGDEEGSDEDSNPLEGTLGPSLASIPVDAEIVIDNVETIPNPTFQSPSQVQNFQDQLAVVVAFNEATTLTIRDGDDEVDTLTGMGAFVGVSGTPVFTPLTADLAIVPMPPGATATFAPAEDEDVVRGLNGEHLSAGFANMAGSAEDGESEESGMGGGQFFDSLSDLAPFLNGAYLDLGFGLSEEGTEEGGGEEELGIGSLFGSATLVRFDQMEATRSEGQLFYEGDAALQVADGEVAGAQPLVGGVIPTLSIVLWLVAVGATVAMLVLRPSKKSKFWDGFHLIGRISGLVAVVVAFFVWDAAIADLLGASIVQGGLDGAGRAAIAAVELVPLLLAALFFGVPTRLIFRAGTRFAGQGRMMNIGNTIAPFVTLIFGLPLLLSLMDSALALLGGS